MKRHDPTGEIYQRLLTLQSKSTDFLPGISLSPELVERSLADHRRVIKATFPEEKQPLRDMFASVNPACPEKSALLLRLLEDKKALRFPPPISFGYPHYEAVESVEPIAVNVLSVVDQRLGGQTPCGESHFLNIDHSLFAVRHCNRPAKEIAVLLRKGAEFDGNRFLEVVEFGPRWTVTYGDWPAWEIEPGEVAGAIARRDFAEQPTPTLSEAQFGGWGFPIDPMVVQSGTERIEAAKLRRQEALSGALGEYRQRVATNSPEESYPADPSQWDTLRYTRRTWILRKSNEWAGFKIPYLD